MCLCVSGDLVSKRTCKAGMSALWGKETWETFFPIWEMDRGSMYVGGGQKEKREIQKVRGQKVRAWLSVGRVIWLF